MGRDESSNSIFRKKIILQIEISAKEFEFNLSRDAVIFQNRKFDFASFFNIKINFFPFCVFNLLFLSIVNVVIASLLLFLCV